MRLKGLVALLIVGGSFIAYGSVVSAKYADGTVRGQGASKAIKDSYIVVLKDEAAEPGRVKERSAELAKKHSGKVKKNYTAALRGFSVQMSEQNAQKLAKDPNVAYVEQDAMVSVNEIQTGPTWGLNRIDQRAPINTYSYASTGNGVRVYVIDSGVRISHADFGGRASNGYDFISNDGIAEDCNGHGTHVAGTVAGKTYGVAKDTRIVAVRVLGCDGSGSWSGVIAGIDWVTKNRTLPAVANMSIGGSVSTAINDAVRNSTTSGVVFAVAAGNSNADACNSSPSSTTEAITVGNVTNTDSRSSSSNYGSCLDIWAPGTNVLSTSHGSDTATATLTGTSMASPHVAGAAALLLAKNPALTPAQVGDALAGNATNGGVKNAGTGSPNKMLFVGDVNTPQIEQPSYCGTFSTTANVAISDLKTVYSPVGVENCNGAASTNSEVAVNIVHTWRGDVVIDLVAPDGSSYRLKSGNGSDSADNVNANYTVDLSSEARNGTWRLKVYDQEAGDTGYIDAWSIKL